VTARYANTALPLSASDVMKHKHVHVEVAITQRWSFVQNINSVMGVGQRSAEVLRLLPDPATAQAQRGAFEPDRRKYVVGKNQTALVTAVKHAYYGGVLKRADGIIVQVEINDILKKVKYIQEEYGCDLADTEQSLFFSRRVAEVCGQQFDGMYTSWEFDQCIVEALDASSSYKKLAQKYGLSLSTIGRGVRKLLDRVRVLGDDDKKARVRASLLSRSEKLEALASLRLDGTIKTPGAPAFMSLQEGAFLIGENMLGADSGMGQNKAMVCAKFRSGLKNVGMEMKKAHTIADQRGDLVSDKDRTKAERYIKAKVCPQTYDRMKKNVIASGILGDRAGGTKPAEHSRKPKAISQMRAAVNNSWLTESMFEQIKKTIEMMVTDGVLDNPFNQPWNELLDACQQLKAKVL